MTNTQMNETKGAMPLKPLNVPAILARYRMQPSKGLGQNFLIDEMALDEIVTQSGVTPESSVLEIGPGLGSLTRHLANRAARVLAVELDRKMIPVLDEVLRPWKNVTVVQSDILAYDPSDAFGDGAYRVVANIPYYITSAVIRHLLNLRSRPESISVTIQKEVAERICADPGDYSLLALSVRIYGEPRYVMTIGKEAFYPAPKIDSAVVRIDLFEKPLIADADTDRFFALLKAGFAQKRKTLRNSLSSNIGIGKADVETALNAAGINPTRRAETLEIDEWLRLMDAVEAVKKG